MICDKCKRNAKFLWEGVLEPDLMICVNCLEDDRKNPMYYSKLNEILSTENMIIEESDK